MNLNLAGKVAVVTGGAKGMGYEIAKGFLKEGCKVAIVEIDRQSLEAAEAQLRKLGSCKGFFCNVASEEEVEKMVADVEGAFGGIDILINNAGVLRPAKIEELEEKDWDFSINVNLKSVFLCSKAALPYMRRKGGGVILNASSFSSKISSVSHGAYSAAKSAVLNFTEVCAAEFAPDNIRVLSYIPGVIATHLTAAMRAEPEKAAKLLDDIALRRFGEPADIADLVVFLASERAGYITGSAVQIHGGKLCVQDPHQAYM